MAFNLEGCHALGAKRRGHAHAKREHAIPKFNRRRLLGVLPPMFFSAVLLLTAPLTATPIRRRHVVDIRRRLDRPERAQVHFSPFRLATLVALAAVFLLLALLNQMFQLRWNG